MLDAEEGLCEAGLWASCDNFVGVCWWKSELCLHTVVESQDRIQDVLLVDQYSNSRYKDVVSMHGE